MSDELTDKVQADGEEVTAGSAREASDADAPAAQPARRSRKKPRVEAEEAEAAPEGTDTAEAGKTAKAPAKRSRKKEPAKAPAKRSRKKKPAKSSPAEAEAGEDTDAPKRTSKRRTRKAEPEAEPEEAATEAKPAVEVPDDAKWYVIHTYSGYENKVKQNLEHRIETMGMLDQIFQVVVPVEEEVDIKDGQRRIVPRKIFPGYVLVCMLLTDESWSVVRNTPAVTGFVGSGSDASDRLRPTPLRQEDVDRILKRMESEEPTIRVSFRIGQNVRIVDGPFTDFHGVVDTIDVERGKVRLLVNFFGRETPVELDFLQVEKV